MGEVYRNGIGGVAKDNSEAVKWYRKSAEQGNAFAQYNLAIAYHTGFGGLVRDNVQADMWISIVASQRTESHIGAMLQGTAKQMFVVKIFLNSLVLY